MKKINIKIGNISIEAEIYNTPTGEKIYNSLPLEGSVNTWGDEIYFGIGVSFDQEPTAREELDVGELAYWPIGAAFCIFFGPTPVSTNKNPRAYSPVNIFGKIIGDVTILKSAKQGAKIVVNKI